MHHRVGLSGYPSQEYHELRASLICDGLSIPLLGWIVPSGKQQNAKVQQAFLNTLFEAVNPNARVIIVTGSGFQNDWFRYIKSLGRDFIGRIRGNVRIRLDSKGNTGAAKAVAGFLRGNRRGRLTSGTERQILMDYVRTAMASGARLSIVLAEAELSERTWRRW